MISTNGRLRIWHGSCMCHHVRHQLYLHPSCLIQRLTAGRDVVDGTEDFREQIPACSKGPLHISQVALNIVASALYLLPHCWYVRTGSKDLRTMPYSTYRWAGTCWCA